MSGTDGPSFFYRNIAGESYMRVVVQRVDNANVKVDNDLISEIGPGLLVYLGVASGDGEDDVKWIAGKVCRMRLFPDSNGKMNLSVKEIDGEILVISQFTLYASTKKGNRPSFVMAADPDVAVPLYDRFIEELQFELGEDKVGSGVFGGHMMIDSINNGPVTVWVDSNNKE